MLIRIERTKLVAMALSIVLSVLPATYLFAGGSVNVPQTGQTGCWAGNGSAMGSCAGSGEDGDTLAGVPGPVTRFTVNTSAPDNSGTVTDNFTGLMWTASGYAQGTATTWKLALAYVANMNNGTNPNFGHTDWRLPNIQELRSLINHQWANPATSLNTPTGVFTSVQADYYWSSTTWANNTPKAWLLYMATGEDSVDTKTNAHYVWPVRDASTPVTPTNNAYVSQSGQTSCWNSTGTVQATCSGSAADGTLLSAEDGALQKGTVWPSTRFTDNGDSTITDGLTGLMWAKDASTPTYTNNTTCTGGALTWGNALLYIQCLNTNKYLCYDDWRLSNVNELISLGNFQQASTATWLKQTAQGFSNVNSGNDWASTTLGADTASAWTVEMQDVYTYHDAKSSGSHYAWPVRGGQAGSTYSTVDVSISQSDPTPINDGTNATYTLTITNSNSHSATGVYVVDTLPSGST